MYNYIGKQQEKHLLYDNIYNWRFKTWNFNRQQFCNINSIELKNVYTYSKIYNQL